MAVGMSQPASTPVIGRDDELDALRAFLDAVEQGPTALLLSGEPGIGKTILWETGLAEARRKVERVLVHRSAEAEALLSFTGLSDLLEPILEQVSPSLPPLRRRALEVALLLAEPGEEPVDPRAIGLALLDVLRALAARGPMLIALDDVQWLDAPSAAVLQIALRRLRDEPVGLLATVRTMPGVAASLELENAFAEERMKRLWLGPLSVGALHRLLEDRLGLELTRLELARVQESSAGNPYFAVELGRELVRTETRPVAGQALRVPDSLQQLLGGRLGRLPPETAEALLLAAALARPTVEVVAAAHAGPDSTLEALDVAVREGLIEIDGSRLRFAHPLLASICYEQASASKRCVVHQALAGAVGEVEERARHLALAAGGPDAEVVSELKAAAEHAAGRGAPAAAAELCELAVELTPAKDARERRRLRLDAGNFHWLAGDSGRAAALLEQLLTETPSGPERANVLFPLMQTFFHIVPHRIELLDEALSEAGDDAQSAQILAFRAGANVERGDLHAALRDARLALELAERVGDPKALAAAISWVGLVEGYGAATTPGLLERGAEIEERHKLVLTYHNSPRYRLARLWMQMGEIDRPREVLEDLEQRAAARGDETSRAMVLWTLGMLEWQAGRWPQALDYTTEARELTELSQNPHGLAWMGRVGAVVEGDLGLVDEARASAERSLAHSRSTSNEFYTIFGLATLGRLELALGNLDAAGELLRELPGRLLAGGFADPTMPIWPYSVETLVARGEREHAGAYLEQFELNSQRFGSPLAVAAAARCRGLLDAAEGNLDVAFEAYRRALAELEPLTCPLDRGRTLLCLGSAHRQAKQKRLARDALEGALAIFDELGAPLWAEKARAELRRISGRRRASEEELTEMEERVATLAAEGRSNKEIAAELFVSVHTVGAHLSRAYRKLDIHSRTELGARLAITADHATPAKPAK
jgi:DNA-binding CsgD family transcriptional regulator